MDLYCRMLKTDSEVSLFVDGVLEISDPSKKRDAINRITAAEGTRTPLEEKSTLYCDDYRDFQFKDNGVRKSLRKKIIDELFDFPRLENDDDMTLGKGGAAPLSEVKHEKKAFYIIGPPASGKSGIANKVADLYGAYVLDSDYAKRKLPEYTNKIAAASLLHDESSALVFEFEPSLFDLCISHDCNIVIPKIGNRNVKIEKFCKALYELGYTLNLISVDLDRAKATQRAFYRFLETERYVPLALIFDGFGNDPTLNYFKIKQKKLPFFFGYAQITTDVPRGSHPILVEEENLSQLRQVFGG